MAIHRPAASGLAFRIRVNRWRLHVEHLGVLLAELVQRSVLHGSAEIAIAHEDEDLRFVQSLKQHEECMVLDEFCLRPGQASSEQFGKVLSSFGACGPDSHNADLLGECRKAWTGLDSLVESLLKIRQSFGKPFGEIVETVYALLRDELGEELGNDGSDRPTRTQTETDRFGEDVLLIDLGHPLLRRLLKGHGLILPSCLSKCDRHGGWP